MIVDVERVAHGGSCVGRGPDGRVVFVRHTLPGEQVEVVVTEERRTYLRADAVRVLRASSARVAPPCPWAGPGGCGGCDWQHVSLGEQRRLKAAVVREQLSRLAGLDLDVEVAAVPDDVDGLGWRTRLRLATDRSGRAGFRRHRSHDIEPIGDCLIAVPAARIDEIVDRSWPPAAELQIDVSSGGDRAISTGTPDEALIEIAADREWEVPVGGFWQAHRGAADLLATVVAESAAATPGQHWLDLFAGVGLFAGVLADRGAKVTAVELDARAVAAARRNVPPATVLAARVDRFLATCSDDVDGVVLDPPRRGAGAAVVEGIARLTPARVIYVACDPASLARDLRTFAGRGYPLRTLRAFDLFPMTAHVECVAVLEPGQR